MTDLVWQFHLTALTEQMLKCASNCELHHSDFFFLTLIPKLCLFVFQQDFVELLGTTCLSVKGRCLVLPHAVKTSWLSACIKAFSDSQLNGRNEHAIVPPCTH